MLKIDIDNKQNIRISHRNRARFNFYTKNHTPKQQKIKMRLWANKQLKTK